MSGIFTNFKCEEALARLHHFIDDELHAGEIAAMLEHLDGCDSCAHEADMHSRLKAMVREACAEVAPDHLKQRITETVADLRASLASQEAA
jgi:mycothiol system anti-sigma-R factor